MNASDDPNGLRRYRLIAEVGHGGMADVFLAVAQGPAGFNKLVVIKKTRRDLLGETDVNSMFLDEARLAARLNHPNVVQTHEIGQDDGRYFIAMEYLDGQPLNRVHTRAGDKMPIELELRVLVDVLSGLHHAHELRDFDGTPLNVVHRDATPQNVFITYDGSIKVVDFGIAKALDSSSQTRTGVVKGKVAYMAPEQVRGERLDRRTDVFAVGVMLWEALAKRRMWEELPEITVVHELMHNLVPSILTAVPHLAPELADICDRAVAPVREHRYPTAAEFAHDVEDYLASTRVRASSRDVGAFVAGLFAKDREKVRGIIEAQLHDVRWTGANASARSQPLPTLEVASAAYVKPSPFRPQESDRVDEAPHSAVNVPSAVVATPMVPTNSGAAISLSEPRSGSRLPVVTIALAGVIVASLVAGGVKLALRSSAQAASAAPSAIAAPASVPPAAATATAAPADKGPIDEAVKVTIRVTPNDAKVYLDDALLSSGSFEGKLVRSDRPRKVRAEADGYAPKEATISFGADIVVSLELERSEHVERPRAPGKVSAPARPKPGTALVVDPKPRPRHDIDEGSPYQKP